MLTVVSATPSELLVEYDLGDMTVQLPKLGVAGVPYEPGEQANDGPLRVGDRVLVGKEGDIVLRGDVVQADRTLVSCGGLLCRLREPTAEDSVQIALTVVRQ